MNKKAPTPSKTSKSVAKKSTTSGSEPKKKAPEKTTSSRSAPTPKRAQTASIKKISKTVSPTPISNTNHQLAEELRQAAAFSQSRDFDSAEACYQRALNNYPQDFLAPRQYGIFKLQQSENIEGKKLLEKAHLINKEDLITLKFLGLAELKTNNFQEAIRVLSESSQKLSKDPDIYYFLAQAHGGLKKYDDAIKIISQALTLKPETPHYLQTLGTLLTQRGSDKQALPIFYKTLELSPENWSARLALANLLMRLGKQKEAISHFAEVLKDTPERLDVISGLGNAYMSTEEMAAAQNYFNKLISLYPKEPLVYSNLANYHSKKNEYTEALSNYEKSLELQPNSAETLVNYGITQRRLNQIEDSLKSLEKAIQLKPDFAIAHWNLSLSLLLNGDLSKGFEEYEWRWRGGVKELRPRKLNTPEWQKGEPLEGKKIFIHSEQGLGDHIQFVRYLPILRKMGAEVYAEFPDALLDLCQAYDPKIHWIKRGVKKFPPFDLFCPLLSIPYKLDTTLESIPASTQYLKAPQKKSLIFQNILDQKRTHKKIGIVWSGNPKHQNDKNRSITLQEFHENIKNNTENITFVSLMKEVRSSDSDYLSNSPIIDVSKELDTFSDTADLIKNLDLVISVDTSVAHLASALGCPTWVLIPYAPDWRWLINRTDTPWYPTMALYRQDEPHSWSNTFKKIKTDLQKFCAMPTQ